MILFPQAKINIGLRIIGVRPDGYHELETLFCRIPLEDALEVIPAEEDRFDDGGFGAPQDNLVRRALTLLREETEVPPVEVILRKRIPTGAGLGGGSSDAAAMLLLLRRLFDLPVTDERLSELALRLGADCPFFLTRGSQIGRGIGERLTPFGLTLEGKVLTLLLPDIAVSTAEAYRGVGLSRPVEPLEESLRRPLEEWRTFVVNDFEATVFALHPELAEAKAALYRAGAAYASMSGSGSALFALSDAPLDLSNLSYTTYSYRL